MKTGRLLFVVEVLVERATRAEIEQLSADLFAAACCHGGVEVKCTEAFEPIGGIPRPT